MSRLKLSWWQRQRLRRQLDAATDARLYRRTLAVLEFARGRPAAEVARLLRVTRQSVYHWAAAYAATHDPAALADAARTGRPCRLDEEGEDALRALLAGSPQDLDLPHTGWTAPLLREALERSTSAALSAQTVRRALTRLGYVWKRPRYVLEPDPQREKKNAGSCGRSGPCRRGVSCWRRTKPTCCSSRPCGRAGRVGGSGPRSG